MKLTVKLTEGMLMLVTLMFRGPDHLSACSYNTCSTSSLDRHIAISFMFPDELWPGHN